MGRPKAKKEEEKEEEKREEEVPISTTFGLFARKPGRSVVMTEGASSASDEAKKNRPISPSSRTKNAICKIRREKKE